MNPPGDFESRIAGWNIYWHRGVNEAGVFEVHFIVRTPYATPPAPNRSEIMEIFGGVCNHVECVPEFVCATPRWSHWVLGLSANKLSVKPLLLGVRPKCGCNPWLDARSSAELYEALREWLKLGNQGA